MAPVTCPNCGSISATTNTLCPDCSHPMRPRPGTAVAVHVSDRVSDRVADYISDEITHRVAHPVPERPATHLKRQMRDALGTTGSDETDMTHDSDHDSDHVADHKDSTNGRGEVRATPHSTAEEMAPETAPSAGEAAPHLIDAPDAPAAESTLLPAPPRRMPPLGMRALPGVIGLAALAALIVMVLPGTQPPQRTEAHAKPTATATLAPTATPKVTPLPTTLPGYLLYLDSRSQFLIQYPATWSKEDLVPSIQFYDNAQSNYVVTILPADPNNGPSTTDATAAAMIWVDMTLTGIQQEETVQNFQRISGPTPAVTIGGQIWQSGIATFGPADAPNRVQVYATVYDGTPFVITLVAPDDLFAMGQTLYFKPMLATFQFLPPSI